MLQEAIVLAAFSVVLPAYGLLSAFWLWPPWHILLGALALPLICVYSPNVRALLQMPWTAITQWIRQAGSLTFVVVLTLACLEMVVGVVWLIIFRCRLNSLRNQELPASEALLKPELGTTTVQRTHRWYMCHKVLGLLIYLISGVCGYLQWRAIPDHSTIMLAVGGAAWVCTFAAMYRIMRRRRRQQQLSGPTPSAQQHYVIYGSLNGDTGEVSGDVATAERIAVMTTGWSHQDAFCRTISSKNSFRVLATSKDDVVTVEEAEEELERRARVRSFYDEQP
ncbi:hypothetical protein JKP88DRAFT_314549 [Tribonema minus]|uniref:Uncharacterized protein n=1 Tax=Tribonema minus TaxID=303371 RepID=A0A835YUA4_9STRA|nr:hypothetical protein JKP88DRAFT_320632 [Tribonema minus]KAG5184527.1 hypothetical protein JKP88DRAFT_314549 [Tribonema minus]